MASRRDLERRIRSIRNTAKITKAMQLVAASRMRRAQARVQASRPYAEYITQIVADVGAKAGADSHPLLANRAVRAIEVVTVTPDRGLAGALVSNLNRETLRVVQSDGHPARVVAVGKKGRDFAVRTRMNLVAQYTGLQDNVGIGDIAPIAREVLNDFESGEVDVVYMIYTQFISTLRQMPRVVQLLPVIPPAGAETSAPWNYEPDNPAQVLSDLLPRYVKFTMYQAVLESQASEHSARMMAMSNATDNANELIQDLTLMRNKARQAEVTREVAEISGAAEAIRTG